MSLLRSYLFWVYLYATNISLLTELRPAHDLNCDHGCGWGNGMERKFLGDYLPETVSSDEE